MPRPNPAVRTGRSRFKDALSELNGAASGSLVEGIDIAELIKDVKLIRIVVIEANKTNRPAMDKAVKALTKSRFPEADKYVAEALQLAPGHPDVLYVQGVLLLDEKHCEGKSQNEKKEKKQNLTRF